MHLNFSYSCVFKSFIVFQQKIKQSGKSVCLSSSGMSFKTTLLSYEHLSHDPSQHTKEKNRKHLYKCENCWSGNISNL